MAFILVNLSPLNRETPKYILYLGKVLPFAAIGLLIVFWYNSYLPESVSPHKRDRSTSVLVVFRHERLQILLVLNAGLLTNAHDSNHHWSRA